MLQVRIRESEKEISRKILRGLINIYNRNVDRIIPTLTNRIQEETRKLYEKSSIYEALDVDGELAYHLGIPRNQSRVRIDTIIYSIIKGIKVERGNIKGFNVVGSVLVYILRSDLREIFNLPADVITVTNVSRQYPQGMILPIMEWLLREGDRITISQYEIRLQPDARSRSGGALMIKSDAGVWRLPPFWGSFREGDNPITRVLTRNVKFYSDFVGKIIQAELS